MCDGTLGQHKGLSHFFQHIKDVSSSANRDITVRIYLERSRAAASIL
jgi:hypothetical protein